MALPRGPQGALLHTSRISYRDGGSGRGRGGNGGGRGSVDCGGAGSVRGATQLLAAPCGIWSALLFEYPAYPWGVLHSHSPRAAGVAKATSATIVATTASATIGCGVIPGERSSGKYT